MLAVLLAALTLLGGCALGRDDTAAGAAARDGTDPGTAEAVRSAARATAAAGGATVAVTSRGPARDRSVTTTGTGSVDLRGRAASLALRVGDLGRVDALTIGRTAYGALPPRAIDDISRGRTWVSVDLDRVDLGLFADTTVQLATGITGNPADLATVLEALTDDVRVVGPETIEGTPTIHFRGGVDLARLAAVAPDLQGRRPPARRARAHRRAGRRLGRRDRAAAPGHRDARAARDLHDDDVVGSRPAAGGRRATRRARAGPRPGAASPDELTYRMTSPSGSGGKNRAIQGATASRTGPRAFRE